jgi:phage terminase large subunit-like protein
MSVESSISSAMLELIRGVPGYDPFRGADGCWFDEQAATLAVNFFAKMLVHIEGSVSDKPFTLEKWQAAIVVNLFGWKKHDKLNRVVRRFRELFVYVPRKNGKTPLCAGIGLLVFFVDNEAGQQGYIAAKDREQAGHLFRQMQGMVERNPYLAKRCKVYGGSAPAGQSKSFVKPDNSFLKVISGDGGGKHGGNPHIVIVDELHEQDNRELLDALTTSMVSANRSQSLFIQLTTADFDRPSICNDKYEYAKKVRDEPEKDPALLPVIWEALPTDDPHDAETWRRCNPNLGVSVSEDDLQRLSNRAKEDAAFEVEFKRLHLNIRTRPLVKNAIKMDDWDACGDESLLLANLEGKAAWAGIDFGWRDDFAALALLIPMDDGKVAGFTWLWLPEDGKRDKRAEPVRRFIASGEVMITPGAATDIEAIYAVLDDIRRRFDLRTVTIDPANARKQGQDLMNEGYDVTEFWQSPRNYTAPWQWLTSEGLGNRKLVHNGGDATRWMAGNVAVEVNGVDQVMPKKKKSAEKIDGICATCMSIGAWLMSNDQGGVVSSELYTL